MQPRPAGSGKRRRSKASSSQPAEGAVTEEEQYHPVHCAVCDQVIAHALLLLMVVQAATLAAMSAWP